MQRCDRNHPIGSLNSAHIAALALVKRIVSLKLIKKMRTGVKLLLSRLLSTRHLRR